MSKNVELYLNTDNKESFSIESNDSNSKEEYIETEEEKKNRLSLENALKNNNTEHAFEKINSKITSFCLKIQILQDYSLCLGSKLDNKQKGEDIEKIITETGDEISETFNLIEVVKNFEYKDRNIKIRNIKQANSLEDKFKNYKKKFDNLINEIKKQNLNLIRQARNSIRYSNFSDFSGEIYLDNETPKKNTKNNSNEFNSEKKYLMNIEMKKKQNNAINKAARKMERSLSRRLTLVRMTNEADNENNSLENFNIDENFKKNNESPSGGSKDFSNRMISKKSSTIFHDMEKKVFIALEGQKQSCIRKYWIFILIFIILILLILYYILGRNDK